MINEEGSCIITYLENDESKVSREPCSNQNLFLCEQVDGIPTSFVINQSIDDVLAAANVIKGYKHPANSMSSCAVFCGKGQMVYNATSCACLEGT